MGRWPGGWHIRAVQRADVLAMIGGDMDPAYHTAREYAGYAAEKDGVLVATGIVTRDKYDRLWAWFNPLPGVQVPAPIMQRCALEMLRTLRQVGEPSLYMICNQEKPGAERWVRHLGFVQQEDARHEKGPVYRIDLVPTAEAA